MAADYYLFIEGKAPVKGESFSEPYKEQIQIHRFTLGASSPTDFDGAAAGRVHLEHAQFEFDSSIASPVLFGALCTNEVLKQVVLSCRKTGTTGKLVMHMQWRFQQARIVGFHMNGDSEKSTDHLEIAYAVCELWSGPQKQDGSVGNGSTAAYDAGQNAMAKSSLPMTKFGGK